ncbi:MAG: hypothetical protein IGR76_17415 [Synechococcales cyanobacterium T60_A2020_003]|nr:hypothetical protein [Synechococcales cyanobacterium T60_A2020_003]
MLFSKLIRSVTLACLLSASSVIAGSLLRPSTVLAQDTELELKSEPTTVEIEETQEVVVDDTRPLAQGVLSVQGGERLMSEASDAISQQDYDLAVQKLQEARQVFNQLSNFNQQLSNSFSGIDNRIAEDLRTQALETAEMRDQATYRLALVHRAQQKPELAVPLLIQIIQSQNPTRELGQQAYQQLFELGFVDSAYPRNQSDE